MVYNSVEHYDYETTDLILVSNGELGGSIEFVVQLIMNIIVYCTLYSTTSGEP